MVKDLFANKSLGKYENHFSHPVNVDGVVMVKLTPA